MRAVVLTISTLVALVSLLAVSGAFAGSVLYVDLNNRSDEIRRCDEGIKESRNGSDKLFHLSREKAQALSGGTCQWREESGIQACHLKKFLRQIQREWASVNPDYAIDTLVISGDSGSGHFTGSEGEMTSNEIRRAIDFEADVARSEGRASVTAGMHTVITNGCYEATLHACDKVWMKNISKTVNTTIGFTGQGPKGTAAVNYNMMYELCKRREQIDRAGTEDEFNRIFQSLEGIHHTGGAAICAERGRVKGICSYDYANAREDGDQSCFRTYEEIDALCSEFDPDKQPFNYWHYFDAEPGFENPPDPRSRGCVGKDDATCLRQYYSYRQLWRHCEDRYKASNDRGLPQKSTVVRLVFFDDIKATIAELHAGQINWYNQQLQAAGLSSSNLGLSGLKSMSRAEVIRRVREAKRQLEVQHAQALRNRKGTWIASRRLKAAEAFESTLVELKSICSSTEWIDQLSKKVDSSCLRDFPSL